MDPIALIVSLIFLIVAWVVFRYLILKIIVIGIIIGIPFLPLLVSIYISYAVDRELGNILVLSSIAFVIIWYKYDLPIKVWFNRVTSRAVQFVDNDPFN